ncbi:MAG: WecB/TagA/CpsF family glycosyltransferase [Nostoc desertorum CM1-VF14]|jgi:N-acetylglucosaminyldiphosphoundecaprenol N-acetyl-beta-D-mannosaminyltransferase|nr:WecB/TagA/CpsF family glycosyltransferase [Nostoc desertorum CM1-VF14]
MADRVSFLNTDFDRMPLDEATELLLMRLLKRQGGRVYYANAHTMVTAAKNPAFAKALEQSDLLLADGSGVRWGSAFLGTPLVHNLNGTDLVPALCKDGAAKGLSVYFLGGKPGVAEDAAANLKKAYSGLIIAGTQHGYFPEAQTQQVLEAIRIARPHLLLVAMGVPLQEIWINQYASQLPSITCMGVGGLFDFMAERVPRAPYSIRAVGMEWLWRLAMEPTRLWQRYLLGNLIFLRLVLTYAFARRQSEQQSDTKFTAKSH